MDWATFWAIFSQAHLVTLLLSEQYLSQNMLTFGHSIRRFD
jgi:hypothetical protein